MAKLFKPSLLVFLLLIAALFAGNFCLANDFFDEDDEEDAEAQVEERVLPQPMQAWLDDLKQEVDAEEILELNLEEEIAFALYLRAYAPEPKGQVVFLPGANEHPNWPRGIASLRKGLAAQGWTSLALALPFYTGWQNPERQLGSEPLLSPGSLKKKVKVKPAAKEEDTEEDMFAADEDSDDLAEETDQLTSDTDANQALFNQLVTASEARLTAGLEFLLSNQNAEKQVLVFQGESLFWLTNWLIEANLTPKQPLVLLFTREPVGTEAKDLEKLLEGLTDQPILDIYLPTSRHQQALAQKRKIAYLRAGNKHAVQLEAKSNFSPTNQADQDWLVKRVEGWLRRLEKK